MLLLMRPRWDDVRRPETHKQGLLFQNSASFLVEGNGGGGLGSGTGIKGWELGEGGEQADGILTLSHFFLFT